MRSKKHSRAAKRSIATSKEWRNLMGAKKDGEGLELMQLEAGSEEETKVAGWVKVVRNRNSEKR